MVTKHLGSTIDVACGGIDNLVRHHDYNIAIMEAVSGKEFSNYWLHGAHLYVDGKKMSKSIGNVYYPNDLIKMGYRKEHLRFFLIYGNYRKRLNFTFEKFKKTSQKLDTLKNMVNNLQKTKTTESNNETEKLVEEIISSFEKNMNNDLNVKDSFDQLFQIISKLNTQREQNKLSLKDARTAETNLQKIDRVLQIIF